MPGRDAEAHAELLTRLHEEGTAMLGPARVNGQACVRACITNHRTTESDIDLLATRLTAL